MSSGPIAGGFLRGRAISRVRGCVREVAADKSPGRAPPALIKQIYKRPGLCIYEANVYAPASGRSLLRASPEPKEREIVAGHRMRLKRGSARRLFIGARVRMSLYEASAPPRRIPVAGFGENW